MRIYHAARERQSFIEGRIAELEEVVSSAEVIDPSTLTGEHIKFGAQVKLVDEEYEAESIQIVGVYEADIKLGRLSISSPLAKSLIGKKVGDTVSVPAPGGDRTYEFLLFVSVDMDGRSSPTFGRPRAGIAGRVLPHARPLPSVTVSSAQPGADVGAGNWTTSRRPAPSRSVARRTSSPC